MKVLLDTRLLLWCLTDDPKLPTTVRKMLSKRSIEFYYSSVSIWEIAMKHAIAPDNLKITAEVFDRFCQRAGFISLPLLPKHTYQCGELYRNEIFEVHKDPFDKLLISQAESEDMIFLTHDKTLSYYTNNFIVVA